MLEVARMRLEAAGVAERVRLITSSFEGFVPEAEGVAPVDVVFSSYALHHLRPEVKRGVLKRMLSLLKPGGWFLNADLVSHADPGVEAVIQRVRVDGIVARNVASSRPQSRFADAAHVREFLDGLEEGEGDCPLTVEEDLALLRAVGVSSPTVFWQEYREVVMGGWKGR